MRETSVISWPVEAAEELRERETEPGNASGMGRVVGLDQAPVPENKTVRAAKGNEADSATSNRIIPLPGFHALPGNQRQALGGL